MKDRLRNHFFAFIISSLVFLFGTAFGDEANDYMLSGYSRYNASDMPGAMADFHKAIALKSDFAEAYNGRGLVYLRKGDLDSASADFSKAANLNPNYEKAIKHLADSALALKNRSDAKLKDNDFSGALADANKALELNPSLTTAYVSRGEAKEKMGDLQGAKADYAKANDLNSDVNGRIKINLEQNRQQLPETATSSNDTFSRVYVEAIESVLRQDARCADGTPSAITADSRMRSIDTSKCPTDFRAAYLIHIHAWDAKANNEQKASDLLKQSTFESVVGETIVRTFMGDPFGKSKELTTAANTFQQIDEEADRQIVSTWNQVESLAVQYGAKLPTK